MEKREIELKLVEKFSSRNLDPDKNVSGFKQRCAIFFFLLSHQKIIRNFAEFHIPETIRMKLCIHIISRKCKIVRKILNYAR